MLNPLTHRRILKKGVPGRASIVERGVITSTATSFNLPMTLQVFVEGMTAYEVEDQWMVKADDVVGLSGQIPVMVHRGDPQKVAIDWDGVRAAYSARVADRRHALQTEASFEPVAASFGAPPTAQPKPSMQADTIEQLERLAKLRESGALTDEEFDEQKRRVLRGA